MIVKFHDSEENNKEIASWENPEYVPFPKDYAIITEEKDDKTITRWYKVVERAIQEKEVHIFCIFGNIESIV